MTLRVLFIASREPRGKTPRLMHALPITINYWLVATSVLTSIIASYAAFSFAERVATSSNSRFFFWLAGGAFAMGLGIWSMHYLGMLSVQLPIEVLYHVPTVLLSLLLAVLASATALFLVSRQRLRPSQIAVGGALMGSGIGAMHYTGMHAMRCAAMHHYRPLLVCISIIVAVVFSWMALGIAFALRTYQGDREWLRLGGAVLMGSGIAAMHYTAMAAVSFLPDSMRASTVDTIRITHLGVVSVALTTALVLFGALLTALLDRQMFRQLQESHRHLNEARAELLKNEEALKQANACLAELSIRDGLTGLYNRRYFDEVFEVEWRRAQRAGHSLSLLLIDIDHFKALNDAYGHPEGDSCLRIVAQCLRDNLQRPGDMVSRYGGEEFAAILPASEPAGAHAIAERIRLAVKSLTIPNAGSSVSPHVTISVGVGSQTPSSATNSGGDGTDPECSPAALVRAADAALYFAKANGRNRTETAESPEVLHLEARLSEEAATMVTG